MPRDHAVTKPGTAAKAGSAEPIKVFCRFRRQQLASSSVRFGDDGKSVYVPDAPEGERPFCFDRVFQADTGQREVYECVAQPVVEALLEGINGTIFAYGHTSSGKTYTMEGNIANDQQKGIIPRIATSLFDGIAGKDMGLEFHVKVSVVEIYKEKIRDLLAPTRHPLKIYEDKRGTAKILGATEYYVACAEDILEIVREGSHNRSVGATDMNEHSSRSHLVFMIMIEQRDTRNQVVKASKLHLVDLAGSELASKALATHFGNSARIDESKSINTSLSALGNVIRALSETKPGEKNLHVPYRNSKLTRILKESLGGCARTALIIACSAGKENEQETLSTLRFGQRAKTIENVVKVNSELRSSNPLLFEAYQQIAALTRILHDHRIEIPGKILTFARRVMLEIGEEDPVGDSARDPENVAVPGASRTRVRTMTRARFKTEADGNHLDNAGGAPDDSRDGASPPRSTDSSADQEETEETEEVLRALIRKSLGPKSFAVGEWDSDSEDEDEPSVEVRPTARARARGWDLRRLVPMVEASYVSESPIHSSGSNMELEAATHELDKTGPSFESCIPADPGFDPLRKLLQELDTNVVRMGKLHKLVVEGRVQLNEALTDVRATRWKLEKEALSVRNNPQAHRRQSDERQNSDNDALGPLVSVSSTELQRRKELQGRELQVSRERSREQPSSLQGTRSRELQDSEAEELGFRARRVRAESGFGDRPRIARPVRGGSRWSLSPERTMSMSPERTLSARHSQERPLPVIGR